MEEESVNDKDKRSDPDKDFGLPKVDIRPIQHDEELSRPAPAPLKPKEVANDEKSPVKATAPKAIVSEEKTPSQKSKRKGNSYTWLIILLIFLGLGMGAWFYYTNNRDQMAEVEDIKKEEIEQPFPAAPAPKMEEEPEEPIEKITLTEIRSRADRPRYFVVVGSFIDEDLAKDYSQNLHQKEINTFLVYPYGEIAYYRLAIGHFDSFGLAVKEIDRVKSGFEENLWVLKY